VFTRLASCAMMVCGTKRNTFVSTTTTLSKGRHSGRSKLFHTKCVLFIKLKFTKYGNSMHTINFLLWSHYLTLVCPFNGTVSQFTAQATPSHTSYMLLCNNEKIVSCISEVSFWRLKDGGHMWQMTHSVYKMLGYTQEVWRAWHETCLWLWCFSFLVT
jgi:hypothetical protein